MTEHADVRVTCPSCGKTLRFPPSAPPGKEYRCPKCNAHVNIPGAAPVKSQDVFLAVCPVCAKGKVVKNAGGREDETFTCSGCGSTLAETIFGFLFVNVNTQHVPDAAKIKAQTFTKPQLQAMSDHAAQTGTPALDGPAPSAKPAAKPARRTSAHEKAKPAPEAAPAEPEPKPAPEPAAPPAAEPETPAEAKAQAAPPPANAPELAAMGSELVGEASGVSQGAGQEEELWWEVDQEEMEKRKAASAKPGA